MKNLFIDTYIKSKLISKDEKTKLIQYLRGEGFIYTRKSKNISGLNCIRKDDNDKLNIIFDNIETIIDGKSILEAIERHEINRNYKYSAIFKIKDYEVNKNDIYENITTQTNKLEEIEDLISYIDSNNPKFILVEDSNDCIVLKLNYRINSINETMDVKYPVLCVLYKDLGIVEIRLTGLNNQFKSSDTIYKYYIDSAIRKLNIKFNIEVEKINFREISKNILEEKIENVVVYSQWMEGSFGSHARLKVSEDGDNIYTLPILGQLDKFIEDNEVFKYNNEAKMAIKEFINTVNEEHDFVRRAICWLSDDDSIDYVIEFIHEYKGADYSVLQNYFNNHDMEDMNDVTRNIISYEK